MTVFLTGMFCSGKTTVGKELWKKLLEDRTAHFIDLDECIEKFFDCKIKDIIRSHGDDYFAGMEEGMLRTIWLNDSRFGITVIATGGRTYLRPRCQRFMYDNGTVFYIKTSPEKILERCIPAEMESRGIKTIDLAGITETFGDRDPQYSFRSIVIDGDGSSKEIADKILKKIDA